MRWILTLVLCLAPSLASAQYATSFAATENPISEGGKWINGKTVGLDWTNVRTTSGHVFGTEPGNSSNPYDDSTAVLTGSWASDQSAQATVYVSGPISGFAEVELRLRTSISAHRITGYEFNCSVVPGNGYMQIVRWNGPLGSFTLLDGRSGGCVNGDVIRATAQGSTLTIYRNGAAIFTVSDSTFSSGAPGIGFFLQNATGINANYGFLNFSAAGGSTGGTTAPNPPTNVRVTRP